MNAEQRQRASQLVRSQTEEEAIGEAFALLQELIDAPEPEPVAWIMQNRLTQACYVYATEQPADPNHIQVPVYTAPPAPEPEPSVPDGLIQNLVQTAMRGLLTDDDMANLRRFDECCQDSDADGHTVAKPKMKRLELAGVVRSCGFGRHETTAFGDWLLADALQQAGCSVIYEDAASGKSAARPELEQCRKALRAGDTLVVWRLDRLGRSLHDLVQIVAELEQRGVHFESLTELGKWAMQQGTLTQEQKEH